MGKRQKTIPKPRSRPSPKRPQAKPAGGASRLASLDTLRGLAIVLMVVDHIAWLFGDSQIAPLHIRFFTRLAMPLFCALSGYLLARPNRPSALNPRRLGQVAGAAAVVNLAYFLCFPQYGKVEILASLLVCYLIYGMLGRWTMLLLPSCWLLPWDAAAAYFDYPVTVVMTCVASGMLLRELGSVRALVGCGVVVGGVLLSTPIQAVPVLVPTPTVYVLYFLPLALLMVFAAAHWPRIQWVPLTQLGAQPLRMYVGQYLVLLAAHRVWQLVAA